MLNRLDDLPDFDEEVRTRIERASRPFGALDDDADIRPRGTTLARRDRDLQAAEVIVRAADGLTRIRDNVADLGRAGDLGRFESWWGRAARELLSEMWEKQRRRAGDAPVKAHKYGWAGLYSPAAADVLWRPANTVKVGTQLEHVVEATVVVQLLGQLPDRSAEAAVNLLYGACVHATITNDENKGLAPMEADFISLLVGHFTKVFTLEPAELFKVRWSRYLRAPTPTRTPPDITRFVVPAMNVARYPPHSLLD